ncbi:unnamed protein product [Phaedon cochleariae]|uniref:Choline transporter-like protein n=1 Tax=Phaedon cochleariae TaxID=80249 RepID=A0A9N9SEH1_PHACE|nr:unnamed protein product [Phaedon cochleariae]
MGETLSKDIQPEELAIFKKLPTNTLLDNIQIPERPENRRPTDSKFIIVFAVVLVLLLPFLIYTLIYSDIDRFSGYDQCGNICGKKNSKQGGIDCSGQDFTRFPYLQIDLDSNHPDLSGLGISPRKCVESCSNNYVQIFGNCYLKQSSTYRPNYYNNFNTDFDRFKRKADYDTTEEEKIVNDLTEYLNRHAWRIVLCCFLSLGVALGMLVLFKAATAAVVWGILGGVLIFGAVCVGGLWYFYLNMDKYLHDGRNNAKSNKNGILGLNIFFTIGLLVLLCVMVFMYRKIQLVIQLLKEATKAAFSMPLLIFTPIITFFSEAIIVALLITTSVYMSSSGILTPLISGFYQYQMNNFMVFTLLFNFWMAFWSIQFVIGIQYMVIAGAVATWYFSKNKHNLDSPITRSASIVFRFHLGSIFFGSLVITIMAIIRALLSSITKNKNLKACVDFCTGTIESFLKFLSKNSYILTAMHGKPFFKSGKRAAKIIFQNAVNIASVNYIGDFVLGMAQLLIVLISLLITAGVMSGAEGNYVGAVYVIVFIVSLAVAVTFFSIFETTIDTIFLCFCEDSLLNDGMSRPYAMSRDLMEFVENSKLLYGDKK